MSRQLDGEKTEKRKPLKPRPLIIRLFGALKRYENRHRLRRNSQHQVNERMMAWWTRGVGLFTGALFFVGIITAVIFWRQLNVMQGQLDEMRKDSQLGARAFINVERLAEPEQIFFPKAANWEEEDVLWTFRPIFSNSGKTPAVNIRVLAVVPRSEPAFYGINETVHETNFHPVSKLEYDRHAPADPEIMFSWPKDRQEQFRIKDFVYLGANAALTPLGSMFAEWRHIDFQKWLWWFYFGSIHYDDFFGIGHVSKFCFIINPAGLGGIDSKTKYITTVQTCSHWNCMDDSCKKDREEYDREVAAETH
jgi:hypothetical protein